MHICHTGAVRAAAVRLLRLRCAGEEAVRDEYVYIYIYIYIYLFI